MTGSVTGGKSSLLGSKHRQTGFEVLVRAGKRNPRRWWRRMRSRFSSGACLGFAPHADHEV